MRTLFFICALFLSDFALAGGIGGGGPPSFAKEGSDLWNADFGSELIREFPISNEEMKRAMEAANLQQTIPFEMPPVEDVVTIVPESLDIVNRRLQGQVLETGETIILVAPLKGPVAE